MKRLNGPDRKAERSAHPTQPARRPNSNKAARKSRGAASHKPPYRKLVQFPQAKGKVLEVVEFSTSPGYHCISINFEDKTCLNFAIDTNFTLEADYSDWTTGNQSILRQWPPISSS